MKTVPVLYTLFVLICLNACGNDKLNSSFAAGTKDTINAGYTYWWPAGGPFIGLCGDPYALVFTGVINNVEPKRDQTDQLEKIVPQKGTVKIKEILFNSTEATLKKDIKYHNQRYFSSECFYGKQFKPGDKVLIFLYAYEGEYSIPPNSILKLNSFEEAAVSSIKTYIKNNQNPISIKNDIKIWKEYGFDEALEQIINCKSEHLIRKK